MSGNTIRNPVSWGRPLISTSSVSEFKSVCQQHPKPLPAVRDEEFLSSPQIIESRLLTKIDLHVIPCLFGMYLLAFLDRVNIANARILNLEKDLGMLDDSNKFNTAILIFFIPYILFEIPSNILLKRFKPSTWLSLNMLGFGLVTICQGLVSSYAGLLTTRFFLGFFESGMFPGALYLISMWYRRQEAQRRYTVLFNSNTLAGAFGGLFAAALGKLDGTLNYSGWRWIFIIEGIITVAFACLFYFCLPNFPEQAQWLRNDERSYVAARIELEQGKAAIERQITLHDVRNVFMDYKVILGGVMYFGLIVPAYGYAYFSPTIVKGFGYGSIGTQLHSVAPWAVAFCFSLILAYISDKLRHRAAFAVFPVCLAISGFAVLLVVTESLAARESALFLVAVGTYSAMPIVVCWFTMNLGGHHRRAVGSAWQVSFGNVGGIIAAFAFEQQQGGKLASFRIGYSLSIAFGYLSMLASVAYGLGCLKANQDRKQGKVSDEGLSEEEKVTLGDMSSEYRYFL